MKIKSLLIGMLASVALVGCTNEDEVIVNNDDAKNGKEFYAVVSFAMPGNSNSRAANFGGFEDGDENEVAVHNVNFFFLNANGTSVADAYYVADATNFNQWQDGNLNEDQLSQAVVVMKNPTEIPARIVAVINTGNLTTQLDTSRPTLGQIQNISGSYATNTNTGLPMTTISSGEGDAQTSTQKGNVVMTSTSYMDGNGKLVIGAPVSASNIFESTTALEKALGAPALDEIANSYAVVIPVEKVLAKVQVNGSDINIQMDEDNKSTANIGKLTTKNATTGITETSSADITLTVDIDGWWLDSAPTKSWLLKKLDLSFAGSWWNDIANTRSYWANSYNESDQTYANYIYESDDKVLAELGQALYCQENTAHVNDVTQEQDDNANNADNVYDVNDRTKVVVAATLKNNGQAIDLVKWYGNYYTKEAFMISLANLNDVKKYYVVDEENSTSTHTVYKSLQVSDLKMVYNEDKDDVENGAEITTDDQFNVSVNGDDIRNYEAAVQLNDEEIELYIDVNGTMTNISTLEDTEGQNDVINSVDDVNEELKKISKVLYWNNGRTYYYVNIEHYKPEATTGSTTTSTGAEFGVVRNHLYKLELTGIKGLGTPVPNPNKIIIPEHKVDAYSETYISARIQILSYKIVNQDNIVLE